MYVRTVHLSIVLLFLNHHLIFSMEQKDPASQVSAQQGTHERRPSWSGKSSELSQALDRMDQEYVDLSKGSGNHPLDLPSDQPSRTITSMLEELRAPDVQIVHDMRDTPLDTSIPEVVHTHIQQLPLPQQNTLAKNSEKNKFLRCIYSCTSCFKKSSTKSLKPSQHV